MNDSPVRIALVGDYSPSVTAHRAIPIALKLTTEATGRPIDGVWCDSTHVSRWNEAEFAGYDGIWCVPASPYKSMDGALRAIRHARERKQPFLGTCGGFQYALIEFARNVLGMAEADHAESNPETRTPVISPLACELVEKSGAIQFKPGSRLADIYGASSATEQYHCRYGLNPGFEQRLRTSNLHVTGTDVENATRAVELRDHPFFIATLFQPERSSLKNERHPIIQAFVAACDAAASSASLARSISAAHP